MLDLFLVGQPSREASDKGHIDAELAPDDGDGIPLGRRGSGLGVAGWQGFSSRLADWDG